MSPIVQFNNPMRQAFDHQGQAQEPDLGGQLGMSEVLLINGPTRALVDATTDDAKAACNNVTIFGPLKLEDGSDFGKTMRLVGILEFGQATLSTPPIEFALGIGQSFSVPGSAVKVSARFEGDTGLVLGTEKARVGAFLSKLPYPRSNGSLPLLANVPSFDLAALGGSASVEVPLFATAFRCEFGDPDNDQVQFQFFDPIGDMYIYTRQPGDVMPWVPILPSVREIFMNQQAGTCKLSPMISLEF